MHCVCALRRQSHLLSFSLLCFCFCFVSFGFLVTCCVCTMCMSLGLYVWCMNCACMCVWALMCVTIRCFVVDVVFHFVAFINLKAVVIVHVHCCDYKLYVNWWSGAHSTARYFSTHIQVVLPTINDSNHLSWLLITVVLTDLFSCFALFFGFVSKSQWFLFLQKLTLEIDQWNTTNRINIKFASK